MSQTQRMSAVQAPVIPIVGELIRNHPGTISLGQGVVFYGPPKQATEALATFLQSPDCHKYKPVEGIDPLLDALRVKLKEENNIDTGGASRIVVTAGGNLAFAEAVTAIADAGDEVILQSPFYFNHDMAIVMAGCKAVVVPTDDNYQLRLDAIKAAITPRTKAIVTVSPNNPTGAVYSEAVLREVNELCRARGLFHIHDEAYEYFTYGEAKHFSPGSIAGAAAHTISLYSLSKAYGFASWRIGYMVIPEALFGAVKKIQDTWLICPPVVSQYAAAAALKVGRAYAGGFLPALEKTRASAIAELRKVSDVCVVPETMGAFYLLIRVQTQLTAMEAVERLVKDFGVAVIPGSAFGMSDGCYLRISYGALKADTVVEGMGRLVRGLRAIAQSQ